MNNFLY